MNSRATILPGENLESVTTDRVVELLKSPATFEESPASVECIETHISWVFLTDRFAYKLKKPIRFDFLDFSTLPQRKQACDEEVRLNRRLAPHVYLGVVPITMEHGDLRLDGGGRPVEWVVKMHRLPADRSLDRLIRSGTIKTDEVRRIGRTLSQFYEQLPPLALPADQYRCEIGRHVRTNRHELLDPSHGNDEVVVRRVHEAQLRLFALGPELIDNRVLDGRIVEGHGDLRPEHIYLVPFPTIIDGIEFNAELRRLDVLDELAFLAMECEALGAPWIGETVIGQYCASNDDDPPAVLVTFYKAYRACVRAKVSTLRAEQLTGRSSDSSLAAATQYLRLADDYCRRLGRPLLLVVRGLSGVGKSTLAARLAELLGIERLHTDAIRRELYGTSPQPADFGEGIYEQNRRTRVYQEMLRRAESLVDDGLSVILDGTFLTAASRTDAVALAEAKQAVPLIIHCQCQDDVVRRRITARLATGDSPSESRPDIYAKQKDDEEPDPAGMPVCCVDTENSPQDVIDTVLTRLKSSWAQSP